LRSTSVKLGDTNPPSPMKKILIAVTLLALAIPSFAAAKKKNKAKTGPAWTSLFDGKEIKGFTPVGGTATYRVEDGTIVGKTAEGSKNTFLATDKEYGDFELQLEVKCDVELNSGIQIRSHVYTEDTPQASNPKRIREKGEIYGYQCEITNQEKGVSGNFWDEGRWTKWHTELSDKGKKAFVDGAWNAYRIVAKGDHIQSWVNGVKCADFHDSMDASGFIGLQVHSIKKGSGPYEVRWRNLRIRELK
jgi:hypothetical protein